MLYDLIQLTFVKGCGTFFASNGLDDTGDSIVLLGLSSSFSLNLETCFDYIDWMDHVNSDHGGRASETDVLQQRRFLWGLLLL